MPKLTATRKSPCFRPTPLDCRSQAGAFDLVVSTLFMHHLSPPDLAAMIRGWAGVCRGRLLLNDLVRDWLPYYFFLLARPLFARSPLTRHTTDRYRCCEPIRPPKCGRLSSGREYV